MGQGFKEVAHLKTDLKKLHENWDQIDWGIKKKEVCKDCELDKQDCECDQSSATE